MLLRTLIIVDENIELCSVILMENLCVKYIIIYLMLTPAAVVTMVTLLCRIELAQHRQHQFRLITE